MYSWYLEPRNLVETEHKMTLKRMDREVNTKSYEYSRRGISHAKQLPSSEPITITYNKKERTVKFTSKNFDYSQSNLPQKDFAIAIEQKYPG